MVTFIFTSLFFPGQNLRCRVAFLSWEISAAVSTVTKDRFDPAVASC